MDPVGIQVFGPAAYPLTVAPCGLSGALSATDTRAVRRLVAVGANRTETAQLAPGMRGAFVQVVAQEVSGMSTRHNDAADR
jgi:hypothetical protein